MKIYVGNLSYATGEAELTQLFAGVGTVGSVQVIRDLDTGTSRGFAFVELPEVLRAQEAVDTLNGQKMEGHILRISEARPLPTTGEIRQAGSTRSPKKRAS